jgi:hypothetical protein
MSQTNYLTLHILHLNIIICLIQTEAEYLSIIVYVSSYSKSYTDNNTSYCCLVKYISSCNVYDANVILLCYFV